MKQRWTALLLALGCCGAALAAAPPPEVKAQQKRIEAEYHLARERCDRTQEGSARKVCRERVRGEREVALAEVRLRFEPTAGNDEKLRVTRAEAEYAVARAQCEELDGSARDVCRRSARSTFDLAREEARLMTQAVAQSLRADEMVRERAEAQALENRRRFAAVAARCETLEAPARAECLDGARRRFGQP